LHLWFNCITWVRCIHFNFHLEKNLLWIIEEYLILHYLIFYRRRRLMGSLWARPYLIPISKWWH
jgi:hypothetical protein